MAVVSAGLDYEHGQNSVPDPGIVRVQVRQQALAVLESSLGRHHRLHMSAT